MSSCSIVRRIKTVRGNIEDYKKLAHYHYRDSSIGPCAAVFAMRLEGAEQPVGVIVYTMPAHCLELRNIATGDFFAGFDRMTQTALINENIRCISRVIIEPRFRGLGLAERLVRETLGEMDVPIIEAMAVMGLVNPFFERAGMTAYRAKSPLRNALLNEAFGAVGIEEEELIDSQKVQQRLERLKLVQAKFIERQIKIFLQSYGRRRNMPAGAARTKYILSRLTERPVYYIWFNKNLKLRFEN